MWSWRTTPATISLLIFFLFHIAYQITTLAFRYVAIMAEPDLEGTDRVDAFWDVQASVHPMFDVVLFTTLFLAFTASMAMVSSRYKRLHLLVASLTLSKHPVDDLSILLRQNAAITVYDFPITTQSLVGLYQLLFLQVVALSLSMAGH